MPPRLAILDWMMPGVDGVGLCRRMRTASGESYTYIILLTALQREEDLVIGMEAGADDYITKPFKSNELQMRVRAGQRIVELQDEFIAARDKLREKASHDLLTGLWNHEEIFCILGRELARTERVGRPLSIIMADLDHFKNVNDTYGHIVGDTVLRLTARKMRFVIRSYDAIGRYGGEEFLIVLPDTDKATAAAMAERLRLMMACDCMDDIPEGRIPITISLGVATYRKGGLGDVSTLVSHADIALYAAKEKGRNRVEVAPD